MTVPRPTADRTLRQALWAALLATFFVLVG
jgi:hypothetical protein